MLHWIIRRTMFLLVVGGLILSCCPMAYGFSSSSGLLPSSTFPPSINSQHKLRQNKYTRSPSSSRQPWKGPSIPDNIPALSDILSDTDSTQPIPKQRKATKKSSSNKRQNKATQPIPKQPKATRKSSSSKRQNKPPTEPWKAGYYTSRKSQRIIQQAARMSAASPLERATNVLKTFLQLAPYKCNASNLVCALTLTAQCMGQSTSLEFRKLLFRTSNILYQQLPQLSARQLCNVIWSLAKLYDRDPLILPTVIPSSAPLPDDEQHDLPRYFGRAETWDLMSDNGPEEQLDVCIDQIGLQLTQLLEKDLSIAKVGELCMASWGYGVLRRRRRPAGWKHEKRLDLLPSPASRSDDRRNRNVVKFEKWEARPEEDSDELPDTNSATGRVLDKIGEALCRPMDQDDLSSESVLSTCQWRELVNVAWAFASHGRAGSDKAEATIDRISDVATRRLLEGYTEKPLSRDIAQMVWSLGVLQADNFRLVDSLLQFVEAVSIYYEAKIEQFQRPFAFWTCADIVQVILSLAHARLDESPLLKSLYSEALFRLSLEKLQTSSTGQNRKSFLTWEVSVLLWAQARFNLTGDQGIVFDDFGKKAVSVLSAALGESSFADIGIGPQEQANIAWSLTVLELHDTPEAVRLLDRIFADAASSCQSAGVIQLEHAHQLWQAMFLLGKEAPRCVENVPDWFHKYLKDKWSLEKGRPKISSARHHSISTTLKAMGIDHQNEHDEDIDVAIVLKPNAAWTSETGEDFSNEGMRLAVEFDGPYHFTRPRRARDSCQQSDPPRALGHTVLKYRILKHQGWTVVRVPYFEFDKIPFWSSMERMRYLQRLLKTHGNLQFSSVDTSEYKAQVPNRKSRYD